MSVLVTGGTGYIGSHTVVELINAGESPVIVDNLSNSKADVIERIEKITGVKVPFYNVDVRNRNDLQRVFDEHNFTSCIHFAGLKAVADSVKDPLWYYSNNCGGTVTLLEVMAKNNVKKFVFSSSATVYGTNPPPFHEDMKIGLDTANPYGSTKLFIERILEDLSASDPDFSIALLRYFNPIGAHESGLIGDYPNGIPNNLMPYIQQVAVGILPALNVFGNDYPTKDGTPERDYIHVVDLALGHVKALQKLNTEKGCLIYNLGTGTPYSVMEIITTFEQVNNISLPLNRLPRRPGDIPTSFCNPSKSAAALSWSAQKSLADMCKDSYHFADVSQRSS
ncbi:MAG: UDP-glucose 4-epimerase GalE [Ruminococcus sp.]|jgi:UDP-glucose 4-epimerase|nr:UDP-glucose 4-epimerase GalE [Ruminococcus sp.]